MAARKILTLVTAACFWSNISGIAIAFDLFGDESLQSQRDQLQRQQEEIERNRAEIEARQREQRQRRLEEWKRQRREAEESTNDGDRFGSESETPSSSRRRAPSSVDRTTDEKSDGKKLNGDGIQRTFAGNSGEMIILETDATVVNYFTPSGKIYSIVKGFNDGAPQHSSDWFVSGNQLCMQSAARGRYCYYLTYTPDGLEGWLSKPRGMEKIFLMKMYEGDAYKLREGRPLDWVQIGILAGAALIVGVVLYKLAFDSSPPTMSVEGDDSEGGNNSQSRFPDSDDQRKSSSQPSIFGGTVQRYQKFHWPTGCGVNLPIRSPRIMVGRRVDAL